LQPFREDFNCDCFDQRRSHGPCNLRSIANVDDDGEYLPLPEWATLRHESVRNTFGNIRCVGGALCMRG
jgi:hypothetical protein